MNSEGGYLVPANTKKSMLIMGFLRRIDLTIALTGIGISFLLLAILGGTSSTLLLLLACLPGIIAAILVLPIPNYHNTLVGIQSIMRYYRERKRYIWRGWCMSDESSEQK